PPYPPAPLLRFRLVHLGLRPRPAARGRGREHGLHRAVPPAFAYLEARAAERHVGRQPAVVLPHALPRLATGGDVPGLVIAQRRGHLRARPYLLQRGVRGAEAHVKEVPGPRRGEGQWRRRAVLANGRADVVAQGRRRGERLLGDQELAVLAIR